MVLEDKQFIVENVRRLYLEGIDPEEIKLELSRHGYPSSELDDAIWFIQRTEKRKEEVVPKSGGFFSRNLFSAFRSVGYWTVVAVIILFFIWVIMLFVVHFDEVSNFFSADNNSSLRSNTDNSNVLPGGNGIEEAEINENRVDEEIDCGRTTELTNDCFFEASRECRISKIHSDTSFEIEGLIHRADSYQEIRGIENGNCMFYFKYISFEAEFSESARAEMIASGKTEQEVDQQENNINEAFSEANGKGMLCEFNTNELYGLLSRWKNGLFTYSDFDGVGCSGELAELGT